MRINGVEVSGPNEEILVLPRKDQNIVFRAVAIPSFEEFEAQVPTPKAPGIRTKDGFKLDEKDPTYRQQKAVYSEKKIAYMVVRSLEPSNIEWETVNIDKPNTWLNWSEELKNAGFSEIEIGRIQNLVLQANSLDESKIEAARKDFLLGEEAALENSSSQNTEQPSTQSGQPVNDSE